MPQQPIPTKKTPTAPADIEKIKQSVELASAWLTPLRKELEKNIVGQKNLIESLLIGILSGGHILLEGLPGLAKTLAVKTLSQAIQTDFQRIQFTPDMLPADIIGTQIYNPQQTSFETKKGPIFSSIILADEINRAPAKVQSALLEAMQEKQVTIGEKTYPLPELFLVMATQNPIEQEGTYPLPEAQVDRFMLKTIIGYPSQAEERQILDLYEYAEISGGSEKTASGKAREVKAVVTPQEILTVRKVVSSIYMDEKIKDYIVSLIQATRTPQDTQKNLKHYIETGASPRATISLKTTAKCLAFLAGRAYVTPDDIKRGAMDVMRHRIRLSYEAEAEGVSSEDIIRTIIDTVPVP